MQTYVVRFSENERDAVLKILAQSNDVVINKVEPESVFITVQLDDTDTGYASLLERIESDLIPVEAVLARA